MQLDKDTLTWKCHICGRERPDDKISVVSKAIRIDGRAVGMQNIRYCNDNPECASAAREYDFFKEH